MTPAVVTMEFRQKVETAGAYQLNEAKDAVQKILDEAVAAGMKGPFTVGVSWDPASGEGANAYAVFTVRGQP